METKYTVKASLFEFVEIYAKYIVGPVGIENTMFNFVHENKPEFIELCRKLGIILVKCPSNVVARYREIHGLKKDKSVKDCEIIAIELQQNPLKFNAATTDVPSRDFCILDATVGQKVVRARARQRRRGIPARGGSVSYHQYLTCRKHSGNHRIR